MAGCPAECVEWGLCSSGGNHALVPSLFIYREDAVYRNCLGMPAIKQIETLHPWEAEYARAHVGGRDSVP